MSTLTYQKVADYLEKLKTIYETLQIPKKEIKEVEKIIELFHGYGDILVEEKTGKAKIEKKSNKTTKPSFSDIVDSLFEKKYSGLVGTKLHFTKLNTAEQIITYIDATAKTKVMKEATALDLKLLYCLLTEEKQEIKGTKNEVYEAIKRDIRTKRRGKAFLEYA